MDEFSLHELLDRSHLVIEMINSILMEHKNYEDLPEDIQDDIESAMDKLYGAYQKIGQLKQGGH